jgi:hypothetical protein
MLCFEIHELQPSETLIIKKQKQSNRELNQNSIQF